MSEIDRSGMSGGNKIPPDLDITSGAGIDKRDSEQKESGSFGRDKKIITDEYGLLLVKAGRLLASLFLAVVSLVLFLAGKNADAVIVLSCLLISYLFASASDRGQKYTLWPDKKASHRLSFSVLVGPPHTNGMFIPLKLRYAPLAVALLCGIVMLIIGIVNNKSAVDIALDFTAGLSPSILLGLGGISSIAAGNAITRLRQHDIELLSPEKIGNMAACDMLLADKSLFSGDKGTEISGVYINDAFCGLSELNFENHKHLVIGFSLCDDGSLTKTYGFKQKISESILRAMRASPVEQREVSRYKLTRHIPFDANIGLVSAECCTPFGNIISFTVGKPESVLQHIKFIQASTETREISPQDLRRLRVKLRQNYLSGKLAAAIALGIPGESALTFLGFVFLSVPAVNDADTAISDLKENGTETMLVTDEDESSSFYRASNLKIASDISEVINGHRIDNFKLDNLIRASLHARLAAEVNSNHRLILGRILHKRKRVLAAASKNPTDTLLENADIRITSEKGGVYPPDVCSRTCKITDVSILIRTAKAVCSLGKRACYHMLFAPLCLSVFMLLCAATTGNLPFSTAVIVPTVLLIPLPQTILIASADYGSEKLTYKSFIPSYLNEKQPPIKIPGSGFAAWWMFSSLFVALFGFGVFESIREETKLGVPVAMSAAYLTLFLAVMLNGLISFVWGKSILSVLEQGGRRILVVTLIIVSTLIVLSRLSGFNSMMGFKVVPYRQIPSAALPSVILFSLYEIMTFARKKYDKRKERLSLKNGI
jgi:magnesium-transporting ATPase (P-type)